MASNFIDSCESLDNPFFIEYEKIPEDISKWNDRDLKKLKHWIVLEKIHGANFSFYISRSKIIRFAKRSSFIALYEDFFGVRYSLIIQEISEKLKFLLDYIIKLYHRICQISLHGELFGGNYSHPDVAASMLQIHPVQYAIMYSPELHFIIYDIAIYYGVNEKEYLNYDLLITLCEKFDLLYCIPLFRGKLNEVLSYDLNFSTKIPSLLKLPKVLHTDNIAEGIIIKPVENKLLNTNKGLKRVIIKRKHPNFIETKHLPQLSFQNTIKYGDDYIKYEILALINYSRVLSALSKMGYPNNSTEVILLVKNIVEDVISSFSDSNYEIWLDINEEKKNHFKSIIQKEINEIIDNDFKGFNLKTVF